MGPEGGPRGGGSYERSTPVGPARIQPRRGCLLGDRVGMYPSIGKLAHTSCRRALVPLGCDGMYDDSLFRILTTRQTPDSRPALHVERINAKSRFPGNWSHRHKSWFVTLHQSDWRTDLKFTRWVRGANPSTLERGKSRAHQTSEIE